MAGMKVVVHLSRPPEGFCAWELMPGAAAGSCSCEMAAQGFAQWQYREHSCGQHCWSAVTQLCPPSDTSPAELLELTEQHRSHCSRVRDKMRDSVTPTQNQQTRPQWQPSPEAFFPFGGRTGCCEKPEEGVPSHAAACPPPSMQWLHGMMVFNALKLQWGGYPDATVLETLVGFSSHSTRDQ